MDKDKLKFEKYRPKYIRIPMPMVAINKAGFSFNKRCNPFFGEAEHCELFYDEEQKVVGIKLTTEPTKNSRLVGRREAREKTGPFISGAHFLMKTGAIIVLGLLRPNVTSKRVIVEWDGGEEMILIDLKKAE